MMVRPDLKGMILLAKLLKSKVFGDDTILQTVAKFAEQEGFEIIPVDKMLSDIKIIVGLNTKNDSLNRGYLDDIELGVRTLRHTSDLDMGQAVVIQNGIIIGIECIEGTQKLIERCGSLKYDTSRKPILVKAKKLNQTRKIDLPAVGVDTVNQVKNAGFAGIVLDSDGVLVINKEEVLKLANELGVFIYGVKI
jgi:DUF1009 family protein